MYHDIIGKRSFQPYNGDPIYSIEESLFAKHLSYTQNIRFKSISLADYLRFRYQASGVKLLRKSIIFTFDDGHISNYTLAFPMLQDFGFTATFFVTVKNISSPHGMTWQQLREMAESGMSIQSHTMTHPFLPDLPPERIKWELETSKSVLEDKLGESVDFLALPGGRYSSTVRRIAEEVGYQGICTSKAGYNTLKTDLYSLRRWTIKGNMDISAFRSIVEMNPLITLRYRMEYLTLDSLKRILGNERYIALREKVLRRMKG